MGLQLLHSLVDRLSFAPGVRHLRQAKFDRYFNNNPGMNLFRGVYDSYEDAVSSIPHAKRAGYDSEEASSLYEAWLEPFDYDYPAIFWIQRSVLDGLRSVCDLGGNIGFKYLAFRKVASFPADLVWTVIDLPAVIERGRAFANQHGAAAQLRFSDNMRETDGHDVLFASGSLQYVPSTLAELLLGLRTPPKRLILNITPVHEQRSFFTVNSFGPGFAAYRVQRRKDLIDGLVNAGYQLRAEWKNPNKALELPTHPELSLQHYSGFCFDRI